MPDATNVSLQLGQFLTLNTADTQGRLGLLRVVLFVCVFPLSGARQDCRLLAQLHHNIPGLLDVINETPANVAFFPKGAKPYKYEKILSQHLGLSLGEVMAVTRNFHEEPVADGSTGLYRVGHELILDTTFNMVSAYARERDALKPGKIQPEDIVRLRAASMELLVVGPGENPTLIEPKAQFKGTSEGAVVTDFVHPEVMDRLRDYGYAVTQSEKKTHIRYVDQESPDSQEVTGPKNLQRFTERLNRMIAEGKSPERIAAFAVQDLLLIHPFKNGNGRTARLLGQILYFKLTGKSLLFPKEFHSEMGFSLDQLEAVLLRGASPSQLH